MVKKFVNYKYHTILFLFDNQALQCYITGPICRVEIVTRRVVSRLQVAVARK